MVNADYPWFLRGGNQNNSGNAGVFAFNRWYGNAAVANDVSFRQVPDYK